MHTIAMQSLSGVQQASRVQGADLAAGGNELAQSAGCGWACRWASAQGHQEVCLLHHWLAAAAGGGTGQHSPGPPRRGGGNQAAPCKCLAGNPAAPFADLGRAQAASLVPIRLAVTNLRARRDGRCSRSPTRTCRGALTLLQAVARDLDRSPRRWGLRGGCLHEALQFRQLLQWVCRLPLMRYSAVAGSASPHTLCRRRHRIGSMVRTQRRVAFWLALIMLGAQGLEARELEGVKKKKWLSGGAGPGRRADGGRARTEHQPLTLAGLQARR